MPIRDFHIWVKDAVELAEEEAKKRNGE